MKAFVEAETCTGCAACVDICPEVFEMEDDLAVVKGDAVPPEAEEACREAVEGCPVEAISIKE